MALGRRERSARVLAARTGAGAVARLGARRRRLRGLRARGGGAARRAPRRRAGGAAGSRGGDRPPWRSPRRVAVAGRAATAPRAPARAADAGPLPGRAAGGCARGLPGRATSAPRRARARARQRASRTGAGDPSPRPGAPPTRAAACGVVARPAEPPDRAEARARGAHRARPPRRRPPRHPDGRRREREVAARAGARARRVGLVRERDGAPRPAPRSATTRWSSPPCCTASPSPRGPGSPWWRRSRDWLQSREILLVLDSFEHLLAAGPTLVRLSVRGAEATACRHEPGRPG